MGVVWRSLFNYALLIKLLLLFKWHFTGWMYLNLMWMLSSKKYILKNMQSNCTDATLSKSPSEDHSMLAFLSNTKFPSASHLIIFQFNQTSHAQGQRAVVMLGFIAPASSQTHRNDWHVHYWAVWTTMVRVFQNICDDTGKTSLIAKADASIFRFLK